MMSSAWRGALFAGCALLMGAWHPPAVAAEPNGPQPPAPPVEDTVKNTNMPSHVVVRNGRGQVWADLNYAANAYEYYEVYSPSSGSGGTLTSSSPRSFSLNGPEHWYLEGGHAGGYTLFNADDRPVYHVQHWYREGPVGTGPSNAYDGVGGDWKVLNAHHKVVYYFESSAREYDVLDKNMHIVSIVHPIKGGYAVCDKSGSKVWYTMKGDGVNPLSASFLALRHNSPWADLLMGAYFFPDWW